MASSCCDPKPKKQPSCHGGHDHGSHFDWLLWSMLSLVAVGYGLHLSGTTDIDWLDDFSDSAFSLMNKMWWGIALGILFVGLLGRVPREFVMKILGKSGTLTGVIRACMAGVLLDLCSHGILMVGTKLYERGASLGQVMAFLIASPWNSLSLTFIMFALMGVKWTLVFMALSMVIAIVSGMVFEKCVAAGVLPSNPSHSHMPEDFHFFAEAKKQLKQVEWKPQLFGHMMKDGLNESKMVLRWVFLGVVLASLLRTFMPTDAFTTWFGASFIGLCLTLVAATVIEVCSEGSTPIAADLLTRAGAPGNSFAFLMAGVSTDYTEIMVMRQATGSWKVALFLPLITLPQIMALSWVLNLFGAH